MTEIVGGNQKCEVTLRILWLFEASGCGPLGAIILAVIVLAGIAALVWATKKSRLSTATIFPLLGALLYFILKLAVPANSSKEHGGDQHRPDRVAADDMPAGRLKEERSERASGLRGPKRSRAPPQPRNNDA